MKKRLLAKCIGMGLLASSHFAYSQSIPVLNHEYEFDTIPHDTQKTTSISGWSSSGDGEIGVEIPLGGGIAYNGFDNLSQAAFIDEGGKISQALDFNLIKGKTYALKYQVGRPLGEKGHSLVARVKANGLTLAQHQTHINHLDEGEWGNAELQFTATENMPIGFPVAVEFYNPPSEVGAKVHLDSVSVSLVEVNSTPSNLINVTVLNNNYEYDSVPVDTEKTDFISGWVNTGNGGIGVEFPQGGGVDYTENTSLGQAAYLEKGGRISQALDITVEKGESYTLNYNVGRPLGTSGHSVIARIKSQGVVLAQKHTRVEHIEPGQRLAQSITFTANESMPLGSKVAIEFYNPPTTAGDKAHIDNVQMLIAGTGEDFIPPPAPKFPDNVIGDVVQTNLTINIPEDFDDLNLALNYLDNKIIQNDKQVTLQVNNCGATYDDPIVMSHPQGSQINIQGGNSNCRLNFTDKSGFIVSTALNKLNSLYIDGPAVNGGPTGLMVKDGATVGESNTGGFYYFENGVESTHGSYVKLRISNLYDNRKNGAVSNFGGFIEFDNSYLYYNREFTLAHNGGIAYALNVMNVYNDVEVEDNAYAYIPSEVYINNTTRNFYSSALSNIDFVGEFTRDRYRYDLHSNYSSWINYQYPYSAGSHFRNNQGYINYQ